MAVTVVVTSHPRAGFRRIGRWCRVASTANAGPTVASEPVSWAIWLAVPFALTLLAALASWLRARPKREPNTRQAMRAHGDYLDALMQAPRSKDRGPHAPGD